MFMFSHYYYTQVYTTHLRLEAARLDTTLLVLRAQDGSAGASVAQQLCLGVAAERRARGIVQNTTCGAERVHT